MTGEERASPPGPDVVSSTGLEPRLASALAYLAWWGTGLLFLALERSNRDVRFHAAQAVVVFGGLSLVMAASYGAALVLVFTMGLGPAARTLMAATNFIWLASALLWAWFILSALRGDRWRMPGVGWVVDRLSGTR